jgi:hypothetical protein
LAKITGESRENKRPYPIFSTMMTTGKAANNAKVRPIKSKVFEALQRPPSKTRPSLDFNFSMSKRCPIKKEDTLIEGISGFMGDAVILPPKGILFKVAEKF